MNKTPQFSHEALSRASRVCAQVSSMISPISDEERARLVKCNGADNLYDDPVQAIVEEDVIRQAPPAFLALAAFFGEAVKGFQDALKIMEAKQDMMLKILSESGVDFAKANQETQEMIKAVMDSSPIESFRAPAAYVDLNKANAVGVTGEIKAPKSFYITKLEEYVRDGKCSAVDMSLFESSGRLNDDIRARIEAEWRKQNQ